MVGISLDSRFEKFVQEQIDLGHFQNADEVVRAGLRLLEDRERGLQQRTAHLKAAIDEAWDDPSPSIPAAEVFDSIKALYAGKR